MLSLFLPRPLHLADMGKLAHLTSLSPFGPIFGKELRTTARCKRTYFLRFFYLLALLLALLAVWSGTAYQREHTQSVAERAQNDARLGGEFFQVFAMFSVFALGLISPILTATAVSAERQEKTLPVLLMTPITSWQIISGKLFSRLLAAFTLIGLSLPVLAVVRLLGSLELEQIAGMLSLCMVTAIAGAAIGLFYSTFLNRAYAVILLAYATMLLLYAFVPFAMTMMWMNSSTGRRPVMFINVLCAINPFVCMVAQIETRNMGRISTIPCVCVHLGFTFLLVLWSSAVVRRLARRQGESAGAAVVAEPPPFEPDPYPAALDLVPGGPPPLQYARPGTGRYKDRPERDVSDNPVLWREVRRPLMARRKHAIIGSLAAIGLLIFTYVLIANSNGSRNPLAEPELQIGYASIFHCLLILLVCVLAATTIAGEKESDTWTLLLAAPITGRAIVMGKLAGILRRMLWPMLFFTLHFAVFTLFGVITFSNFLIIIWVLVSFNAVWIASGLYFSLRMRKTTTAVIMNLLMPVLIYAVVAVLLAIAGNVLDARRARWQESVAWYLPFFYFVKAGEHLYVHASAYRSDTVSMPNDVTTTVEGFIQYVFIVGVGYLAVAALVVAYTIKRFDVIVGRAPSRRARS